MGKMTVHQRANKIAFILWNSASHYPAHNSSKPAPYLQTDHVCLSTRTTYIKLPSCLSPLSAKRSRSSCSPPTACTHNSHASRMVTTPQFHQPTNNNNNNNNSWCAVHIMQHLIKQFFSSTLSLDNSQARILFFSAPYCRTPSAYVIPITLETKFHTHTKQLA